MSSLGLGNKGAGTGALAQALLLTASLALALTLTQGASATPVYEGESASLDVGGDVKGFYFATIPYTHFLMPEDPTAQGAVDVRLKADGRIGDFLTYEAHHQATAIVGGASGEDADVGLSPSLQSATNAYPQALDLAWQAVSSPQLTTAGRIDRLNLKLVIPHLSVTAGRQAITFGNGYLFTPMDLVAPFNPTFIDTEYKPGIDALRAEGFVGTSGQVSGVIAYLGSWDREGMAVALQGSATLGVWDVGVFMASIRGDGVYGVSTAGSIGPVSIRGEGTITLPPEEQAYYRGLVGADLFFGSGLSLIGEVYYQSLGGAEAEDYLQVATSPRFARGELFTMGRYYAALSASYTLTPLVGISAFGIVNLQDPSALVGPGVSWSVSGNASVSLGGYFGLGERPGEVELTDLIGQDGQPLEGDALLAAIPVNSEFGLSPTTVFLSFKTYF